MRILALEPYYGGSHRAFLDGWIADSRHSWTLLTLPPFKWKWRMRHSAWTLAGQVKELVAEGGKWDGIFCSSLLDLATFSGLTLRQIGRLPTVVYFHENQLTYPVRREAERDLHFAFTHLSSSLAAQGVWFNSAFHRGEFLGALTALLRRMPDFSSLEIVDQIRDRSSIQNPGVAGFPSRGPRKPGPLRILWAARWEFDKNPEGFFRALESLEDQQIPYRLNVLGESFREVPEVFASARKRFAHRIDRWGFLEKREQYQEALLESDVFVSTAHHEFFGIAAAEAMAAGCRPLLPNRLAYPELLASLPERGRRPFLYSGEESDLAARLESLAADPAQCLGEVALLRREIEKSFSWAARCDQLDDAIENSLE
ncbi:MAG: DUF3524 domain-containing protein [Deltaproteobacteria bacterium]|nr:DUF3524 domain-containing protein [Deltaproteobacteria bacterium]